MFRKEKITARLSLGRGRNRETRWKKKRRGRKKERKKEEEEKKKRQSDLLFLGQISSYASISR
jgi:hypothetical protein